MSSAGTSLFFSEFQLRKRYYHKLCAIAVYKEKLMFGAFGRSYDVYTNEIVNDGNWHHVVVTYNSSILKMYLDNIEVASEARNLNTINSSFYIGRRAGQENQYMNGLIDDIRLYNRVLSENEINALHNEVPTSLKISNSSTPEEFKLNQNYPNPFNPSTKIHYSLSRGEHVSLRVYNILGQLITTLVETHQPAGSYAVRFDAHDLPGGMYISCLKAGTFAETKKMILLK